MELDALLQDPVFYFFSEISKIPRASGNEKGISDFLKKFAQDRDFYVRQDGMNNIVIKKPGTPGYENAPAVILQGHMDMVCEKNEGTDHDFTKDPIRFVIDEDRLKADGTTLGADNGIAIAYALALLDSKEIAHPPLEIVVTTDEEVGLTGAIEMAVDDLEAKYFINLDSEEEGELVISCAGGLRANIVMSLDRKTIKKAYNRRVDLVLKGLKGGHSGMEIDKQRANAALLMGRILSSLNDVLDVRIANISGGMKDNVIPREAFATFYIPDFEVPLMEKGIEKITATLKNEYRTADPGLDLEVQIKVVEGRVEALKKSKQEDLLFLMMTVPNGIQSMSAEIPGLVESSLNLGKLAMTNDTLLLEFATRSAIGSRKFHMTRQLNCLAGRVGGTCTENKKYPEWPLKNDSNLLELCKATYERMYGNVPIVKGIHAGLEAGVFLEKLPHLDAISFGPNTFDVHSPEEWVSISSTKRTWDFLLAVLSELK